MQSPWDSKTLYIHGQTQRALYGKKLAMLGLVTGTLLAGGIALALPMRNGNSDRNPRAAITLKSDANEPLQPASQTVNASAQEIKEEQTTTVTVNGQNISVPTNGSHDQVIPTEGGSVTVHTDTSSTGQSSNSSGSSVDISIQATVESKQDEGGTITTPTF